MKKFLIGLLTCLCVGTTSFGFVACSDDEEVSTPENQIECAHNWAESIFIAPTCTEMGFKKYVCSLCQGSYTEDISALSHEIMQYNAQTVTCVEAGWNAYEACSREGCTYTTYQEIPPLNHETVQYNAQAATCVEVGWNAYETCGRVGCNYTTYQEISAIGYHQYNQ